MSLSILARGNVLLSDIVWHGLQKNVSRGRVLIERLSVSIRVTSLNPPLQSVKEKPNSCHADFACVAAISIALPTTISFDRVQNEALS